MTAPLADCIRLRAIEPDASTTNTTNAPAFLAKRFARMSPCSTNTRRSTPPCTPKLRGGRLRSPPRPPPRCPPAPQIPRPPPPRAPPSFGGVDSPLAPPKQGVGGGENSCRD